MKKFSYLITIILLLTFSCQDPLDKGPLDVIGSDVVWDDQSLVDAYFADILNRIDVNYQPEYANIGFAWMAETSMGAEGRFRGPWQDGYVQSDGRVSGTSTGHVLSYWRWALLRAVNTAIEELEKDNNILDLNYREMRLGQAYFARAVIYFKMAERYGGVPIIKKVQDTNLDPEELKVPRSTEKETYDFIASDFDIAISYLEGKNTGRYQPSVDAAYALKSRAMLYAGSIAENNAKLPMKDSEGLVGINPSEASRYYNLSIDAAKALLPPPLGTGSYTLRPGNTIDKYRQIFDNIGGGDDTETILYQQFNGEGGIENAADVALLPRAFPEHVNWGASINAYWETVQWFEYKDGTPGVMLPDGSGLINDNVGANTFYDLDWLFGSKDPRFGASIAYPGFSINGTPAYFHISVTDNAAADQAGVPRVAPNQNRIRSALTVYKTANISTPVPIYDLGDNNYMVLRLGEIYLNFAEAAFAVGKTNEALTAINATRTRAGLQSLSSITLDDIKQERKVELCFENHLFWDLRRWREAEIPLSKQYQGINFIWNVANDTYAITKMNAENITRLFKSQDYYLPIPLADIQNNNALKQNPGFEL